MQRVALLFLFLIHPLAAARAAPPWQNLSADVTSLYSWGTYSTNGQPDNSHSGIGLHILAGYRNASGVEAGLTAFFSFPQVAAPDSSNDAAFSYHSFGAHAGYLFHGIIEPFVHYSPFAQLTQTTKSRLGVSTVSTDLSYRGHALGTGIKIYLSPRETRSAQVGLRFIYTRESYSSARVSSTVESNSEHTLPASVAPAGGHAQEQSMTGDTYSIGFFVGI
ncbi:MAG: hypothetical protein HY074_00010 [Deltaproteobacteria bacterium]|nr:hypothetical protein [Deltaproteobacteria bacterium]